MFSGGWVFVMLSAFYWLVEVAGQRKVVFPLDAPNGIGLAPEGRAYSPHITLARWKGRRTREVVAFLQAASGLASERFTVDGFSLFESHLSRHGAHYEEAARYPLA